MRSASATSSLSAPSARGRTAPPRFLRRRAAAPSAPPPRPGRPRAWPGRGRAPSSRARNCNRRSPPPPCRTARRRRAPGRRPLPRRALWFGQASRRPDQPQPSVSPKFAMARAAGRYSRRAAARPGRRSVRAAPPIASSYRSRRPAWNASTAPLLGKPPPRRPGIHNHEKAANGKGCGIIAHALAQTRLGLRPAPK